MTERSADHAFAYRAFISYSHRDKAWADWLHRSLETYRVPSRLVGTHTAYGTIPRRLNPVFRDRDELASATDLGRKVNEALADSQDLIVICSPASATSRWVNEEVLAYKRLGRGERIFCLIVGGEPDATNMPGREAEECFCPALRFRLDANGQPTTERTEPIAADARPGKDGKANAKLKLIAGMLDVGFDALKQREQRRQLQRMTAVAALALIVMAVTIVLAAFALISRHAAVIAQQQAVVAQQAAERRQKQAEDMVGFMLGDLNDKLEQVDRLDIMQAVDDKAMGYFNSLPVADATDSALALRVTALEKIGSVGMDQGKTSASLKAYQSASALAAELARRKPGDATREAAYGDSLKWVGQAYWYQRDLDNALKNFQTASVLLTKAHSAKPDDDDLAFELATVFNDTGHVRETRGDLAAAQHDYTAYLQIAQSLQQRDPGNAKWQSTTGDAWDTLGKVELEQGHLDRAIADYRADQRIKAALAAKDPRDHDAQEYLLISDAILGRTLALCGDTAAALRYTRAAVDSAGAVVAFNPENADSQDTLALYSQQLGGLLRQDGQLDAAATADGDAVRILTGLTGKHPDYVDFRQDLAQSRLEQARLQLARGDSDKARGSITPALATLHALRAKAPDDQSLVLLSVEAQVVAGQVAALHQDGNAAQHAWTQARDLAAPAARAGNDPRVLAAYAGTLLWLGDIDSARPVVARLATMGYRSPDFVALLASKHVAYAVDSTVAQRIAAADKEPLATKTDR